MSIILTSPEIIIAIQTISTVGFLFLAFYTFYSYKKVENKTLLYISVAFLILSISILLKLIILPLEEFLPIEETYFEALFESTQFIAAFLFFYGIRVIKRDQGGND